MGSEKQPEPCAGTAENGNGFLHMDQSGTGLMTDRIMLRKFNEGDLRDLHEYSSQAGVGELAGWPHHESLAQSAETLREFIQSGCRFAIVYKKNNKVIGHIGIYEDSENGWPDTKELGFVLNRDYWNRGIMTETINIVLEKLFAGGIRQVYACCFRHNAPSRHLIEKCGFSFERAGTYYAKLLNRTFDTFEYVYTIESWNSRHQSGLK